MQAVVLSMGDVVRKRLAKRYKKVVNVKTLLTIKLSTTFIFHILTCHILISPSPRRSGVCASEVSTTRSTRLVFMLVSAHSNGVC